MLYLRFKLLEPDRSSNMVFVSKFGEKIGTGFRHNTILYKVRRKGEKKENKKVKWKDSS